MSFQEDMLELSKMAQDEVRIGELLRVLQKGPVELQQKTRERDEAQAALEEAERLHEEARTAHGQAEKDLATTRQRLAQSRENAKRITTETQMEASKVEIASLERRQREFEDQLVQTMEQSEELEQRIAELKATLDSTAAELTRLEAETPKLMGEAKSEAQQLALTRQRRLEAMDPVLRRQYNVAAKIPGTNPMTTVIDKVCQTCRNLVPPQYLVETQQERTIHVCPRCSRFIGKVLWSPDDDD